MTDRDYDAWLDAIEAGEGYYLACPNGHGSLPPRRVCPHCGADDLAEEPLPSEGTVEAHTTVHVGTPAYEDKTPYVTAVADFGAVRLTGLVRGAGAADVENGDPVILRTGENSAGDRLLVFEPR